ncbi:MAG: hypothetical protein ACO3HN_03870 [Opitutales bacterium]
MSVAEFEDLVALFLEGGASAEQVARLRAALDASPSLRARFRSCVRLHQAQLACLSRREEGSFEGVLAWLHAYGQRMGRSFAHLCLLALVFVELKVTIPAEYTGLFSYVEAPAVSVSLDLAEAGMPELFIPDMDDRGALAAGEEGVEPSMPLLASPLAPMPAAMPDMAMPVDPLTQVEV